MKWVYAFFRRQEQKPQRRTIATKVISLTVLCSLILAAPLMAQTAPASGSANLVKNPGLEEGAAGGAMPSGWIPDAWGENETVFEKETANPHSGKTALKIRCDSITNGGVQVQTEKMPLSVEKTYQVSVWMRQDGIKQPVGVFLRRKTNPYTVYLGKNFTVADQWRKYTFTGRPTASNPKAILMIAYREPGALWIDDVSVEEVGSEARKKIPPADSLPFQKGNLLENSSFELGLTHGWSITVGMIPPKQWDAVDRTASASYKGKTGIRLDFFAGVHRGRYLDGKFYRLRPNQTHTLSAWVKAKQPGTKVWLSFENAYGPDEGYPLGFSTMAEVGADWQRISVSGVPQCGPFHNDCYAVRIGAADMKSSGSIWVDAVQLEEGPLTDYAPMRSVEASLLPVLSERTWLSGISFWDEPVQYRILAVNYGDTAAEAKYHTKFTDFWQRVVAEQNHALSIPPGTIVEQPVSLPPPERGSLRVQLIEAQKPSPVLDEMTLTVVPRPRFPGLNRASRFGTHTDFSPWSLAVAKQLGMCWTRPHGVPYNGPLSWDTIEPQPGRYIWLDDEIDAVRAEGIEIAGVLGRTPIWAISEQDRKNLAGSGWGLGWARPTNMKAWGNYVYQVVSHYKGRVDCWEIGNEPAVPYFFNGTPEQYAEMARIAYREAKRANPDSFLVGLSSLTLTDDPQGLNQPGFTQRAIQAGLLQSCDGVSYHNKSMYGLAVYDLAMIFRDEIGKEAAGKPIWLTEGGGMYSTTWHSNIPAAVDDEDSRDRVAGHLYSSKDAAGTIPRTYANAFCAGTDKFIWYMTPFESLHSSQRTNFVTWFEFDGQIQPWGAANAVAAYFMDGTTSAKRTVRDGHLVECAFTRGEKETVKIIWWEGDGSFPLSLPKDAIVYDLMGNPLQTEGGKINVAMEPIYVVEGGSETGKRIFPPPIYSQPIQKSDLQANPVF